MPKESIYVDGKSNKCTKIALFPFIAVILGYLTFIGSKRMKFL